MTYSEEKEMRELREWKDSMCRVLERIDLQGLARLTGGKLGDSIVDHLSKRIPELVAENERLWSLIGERAADERRKFNEAFARHGTYPFKAPKESK